MFRSLRRHADATASYRLFILSSLTDPPAKSELHARPDYALTGRHRLAFGWLPDHCDALLDAGAAWGYATSQFATRSAFTAGIDPDARAIAVARFRHPEVEFSVGVLETLPYGDEQFDVVVCCDTLEHVEDELASLNELWRVLRPGGTLILTTPHRGLFAWLDHANYLAALRETAARRSPRAFARVQRARGKPVAPLSHYAWVRHRHYTLGDYQRLFDATTMRDGYAIDRVRRTGLFFSPLALNATFFSSGLPPRLRTLLLRPLGWLSEREFRISFGPLAYNIGVRVTKLR